MPTMKNTRTAKSKVGRVAELLRVDIERKALQAGDPYLTAVEASEAFGCSTMMANRAMNMLAEGRLLVRHRRRELPLLGSAGHAGTGSMAGLELPPVLV